MTTKHISAESFFFYKCQTFYFILFYIHRCCVYRMYVTMMNLLYLVISIIIAIGIIHINIVIVSGQQQDPSTLNGGSAMAMAGDNCVAIAIDQRFGSGPQMVNVSPRKVLLLHSKLMIAFTGLESDVQSIAEELEVHVNAKRGDCGVGVLLMHQHQAQSTTLISPRAIAALTSNVLYSKRSSPFYCEPIIAGLQLISIDSSSKQTKTKTKHTNQKRRYEAFLCSQDVLGAQLRARDFVCTGVAKNSLYGTAETFWRPGLGPEELGRVCARAFMSALERDCLSGYGARIYIITEDGIVEQELLSRSD